MFSGLIFILFTLLAIAFAPETGRGWPSSFIEALGLCVLVYGALLIALHFQKRWKKKGILPYLELFLFVLFFHYIIIFQRFIPFSLAALLSLICYFVGLGIGTRWHSVLFYIPFTVPFLIYFFGMELLPPLIGSQSASYVVFALIIFSFLFLSLFFQWIWQCKPLPDSPLKDQIDSLCKKHHFRHGGIKIWKFSNLGATAGIIGVIPRFRYILFTEPLLRNLSEEEIVAVFAHEMGHSVHHHLFIYPFLLLGIPLLNSIIDPFLDTLYPLLFFIFEGVWIYLYIRYFFGFFSRHFEREADYFLFSLNLPPSHLIEALKKICSLNHVSLDRPSWHHGSIRSRIEAIQSAEENPKMIKRHFWRLRLILFVYGVVIIFLSVHLFVSGGNHVIA